MFSQRKNKYCSEAERRYTMFATKLAALRRDDIIHGSGNANHLRKRSESLKKTDALETTTLAYGFLIFFRLILKIFVVKELEGADSSFGTSEMCVLFPDQEKKNPFSK